MQYNFGDAISFNGRTLVIMKRIGSGGQGDVYAVRDQKTGQCLALKLLYGQFASDPALLHRKTVSLARHEPPHPSLVWPLEVSEWKGGAFCFTMPLLIGYRGYGNTLLGRDDIPRLAILTQLARILDAVHQGGFFFPDLSSGNVMISHRPGERGAKVALIDCENIALIRAAEATSLGIQGTGYFRAPEILLGAPASPEGESHSLAVLAFLLLVGIHPLNVSEALVCELTIPNVLYFYGRHPRFVFGPDQAPAPESARRRWEVLPKSLRAYFAEVFSQTCLRGISPRPDANALARALH